MPSDLMLLHRYQSLETVNVNFRNLSRSWNAIEETLLALPNLQLREGIEESTLDQLETILGNFQVCINGLVTAGYPTGLTAYWDELKRSIDRLRSELEGGYLRSENGTRRVYETCGSPYRYAFALFVAIQSATILAERDRLGIGRKLASAR